MTNDAMQVLVVEDDADTRANLRDILVLVLDREGRIVRFNPYLEDLSGYKLSEVQGRDWFTTFLPQHDQDRIRRVFADTLADVETSGTTNPIVRSDGRQRLIKWSNKTL